MGVGAGRRPVALSSGYLSPYQEGTPFVWLFSSASVRACGLTPVVLGCLGGLRSIGLVRTQVIVVLTSGWTVLLFDNHLKLLWESTVR